jgi:hypothetical protein
MGAPKLIRFSNLMFRFVCVYERAHGPAARPLFPARCQVLRSAPLLGSPRVRRLPPDAGNPSVEQPLPNEQPQPRAQERRGALPKAKVDFGWCKGSTKRTTSGSGRAGNKSMRSEQLKLFQSPRPPGRLEADKGASRSGRQISLELKLPPIEPVRSSAAM